MKDLVTRRLAVAFAATLAACGGGTDATTSLSGSAVIDAASPAPAPAPASAPPPPPPPPPAPPPAIGDPTVDGFTAVAPGVVPALAGGSITFAADGNIWFSGAFALNQIGRMTPSGAVSYPVSGAPASGSFNPGPLARGPDGNIWFADPLGGVGLSGAIGTIDVTTAVAVEYPSPLLRTTSQVTRSTSQDLSCNGAICTPVAAGTCTPGGGTTCQTVTTGPTPVSSCAASSGNAGNNHTTTTCNTTSTAPAGVAACTAAPASAGNGFVSTTCSGITPGSQAYAITSGPDGNLWFTEYNAGRIGKFDVGTKRVIEYGPLQGPATAIGAGPDGNVWFAENMVSGSVSIVGRITPAGVITEFTNGLVAGSIGAMTTGADGSVWFVKGGSGGSAIGKIDPLSGSITTYSAGLSGTFPLLGGITAGPDGNVWFTDYFDGLIGCITPGGTITEFGGLASNSQLNSITAGPQAGGSKTLWFTAPTANRIGRATLP